MKNKKLVYGILIISGVLVLGIISLLIFNKKENKIDKPNNNENETSTNNSFEPIETIKKQETIDNNVLDVTYEVLPLKNDKEINYYLQLTINNKTANYLWKIYSSKKEVTSLAEIIKNNVKVNILNVENKNYFVVSTAEQNEQEINIPIYVVFNENLEHIFEVPTSSKLELTDTYEINFTNNVGIKNDAVYYLEYNYLEDIIDIHKVTFNNNKPEDTIIDKKAGKIK